MNKCFVPGCPAVSEIGLRVDAHVFPCCLVHADHAMWRLSLTEPEGRSGYLSWRAEVASRGALLPDVLPDPEKEH